MLQQNMQKCKRVLRKRRN